MNDIIKKQAYTISQAVDALAICKTSLYNEIRQGNIRAKKFGSKTIIPHSEIEKWINNLPEMNNTGGDNE